MIVTAVLSLLCAWVLVLGAGVAVLAFDEDPEAANLRALRERAERATAAGDRIDRPEELRAAA